MYYNYITFIYIHVYISIRHLLMHVFVNFNDLFMYIYSYTLSLSLCLSVKADQRPLVSGCTPGFSCTLSPPAALEVHLVFSFGSDLVLYK